MQPSQRWNCSTGTLLHSRCVDTYILNVHAGGIYSEFETFGGYNSVVANGKGIFALADVRTPPVRMWQK